MVKLNQQQDEAVKINDKNLLIVAGPGSGKTRVLVEKFKYLVKKENIDPKRILVITFTEKATLELKTRLNKEIKENELNIYTFHSFCKTMLEKYYIHHKLDFEVLDEIGQYAFIDSKFFELFPKNKIGFYFAKFDQIVSFFNILTDNCVDIKKFKEYLQQNRVELENKTFSYKYKYSYYEILEDLINAYEKYIELLKKEKLIDFSNLQLEFYKFLKNGGVKIIRNLFDYIFIDEYQDTDPLEDLIIRMISKNGKKIKVIAVGDEDQSIYGFRGASIENFRNFLKNYKNSKEIKLETNYRSKPNIVKFYDNFMKDKREFDKEIKPNRNEEDRCVFCINDDPNEVIEAIKKLLNIGYSYKDIAILFRSVRHQGKELIDELKKQNIPYTVYGFSSFLEDDKVIKVLSVFCEYAIKQDEKKAKRIPIVKTFLKMKMENKIRISNDILQTIDKINPKKTIHENFYSVIFELFEFKKMDKEEYYNLALFSNVVSEYCKRNYKRSKNIFNFLYFLGRTLSIIREGDLKEYNNNTIKIMTIHQSKGLEFPVVFIYGLDNKFWLKNKNKILLTDLIPSVFYLNKKKYDPIEEDYRVLYVGLSRAQDSLIVCGKVDSVIFRKLKEKNKGNYLNIIDFSNFKKICEKKEVYEIERVSFSQFNQFLICEFLHNMVYEIGFSTPEIDQQIYGKALHNCFKKINILIKEGKKDIDIISIVNENFVGPLRKQKDSAIKKLEKYLKNYNKEIKRIVEVEYPINYYFKNICINERIDLIYEDHNGNIVISDLKPSKKEGLHSLHVREQLTIYKKSVENKFKDKNILLKVYFSDEGIFEEIEEKKNILEDLERFVKYRNSNKKNKNNAFCRYCVFKNIC